MISQKSFYETKFKEVDSSFKVMEKILENQTKGFEKLDTSLAENEKQNTCIIKLTKNDSINLENIKSIKNTLASNETKAKEKEEKEKKKDLRTQEYFNSFEGRLSKMENVLQTFQEG